METKGFPILEFSFWIKCAMMSEKQAKAGGSGSACLKETKEET